MTRSPAITTRRVRAALAAAFLFVSAAYLASDAALTAFSQARRTLRPGASQPSRYSRFSHDVKAHKIECSSCHKFPSENWKRVRRDDAAFPDITEYPEHASCIGCHRQQFFRGARPAICSICHVTPSPRDSTRHAFPNPREVFDRTAKSRNAVNDFAIFFPHEKHIDIVAGAGAARSPYRLAGYRSRQAAEESCAVCHTTMDAQGSSDEEFVSRPPASVGDGFWLKWGTFKTVPIGHSACFTCHSQETGLSPAPTDCAVCHRLKEPAPAADFDARLAERIGVTQRPVLDAWRRRDSSGTFRHEFASHAELSCDTCHNVQTMDTTRAATKRVSVTSCSMCHVTATEDDGGVMNYEVEARRKNAAFQCTKCHVAFGTRPIPASHTRAIADAGGER